MNWKSSITYKPLLLQPFPTNCCQSLKQSRENTSFGSDVKKSPNDTDSTVWNIWIQTICRSTKEKQIHSKTVHLLLFFWWRCPGFINELKHWIKVSYIKLPIIWAETKKSGTEQCLGNCQKSNWLLKLPSLQTLNLRNSTYSLYRKNNCKKIISPSKDLTS